MDRELVLAGLLVIMATGALLGAAPWPRQAAPRASARDWERAAWRAVWWPGLSVVLVVSILFGWALMEPDPCDEPLSLSAFVILSGFLILWCRAGVRAVRAIRQPPLAAAATVGLWRPRIMFSPALARELDADALEATRAHEAAHMHHRDPLRIWVAQLLTDLQWPWPSAAHRFSAWRHVLELARDEEARLSGADGTDLAAAVLVAARLSMSSRAVASLLEGRSGLKDRINRLLAPLPVACVPARTHLLPIVAMFALGLLTGLRFGDAWVHALVGWL